MKKTTYWHMQMNQPRGRGGGKIDSRIMLKESPAIIGTGEWDDIQCEQFKGVHNNSIEIGDVVLVREGNTPIALCKVISGNFTDKNFQIKYFNENYRNVEILDFYTDNQKFPLPQGTLQRLIDSSTESWKFIHNWHKTISKKMELDKILSVLQHKKQIILQGPPGTGKTYTAKDISEQLLFDEISDDKKSQNQKLINTEQFKLIQFHPSYTYEDFVRGISAKSDNGIISYTTENKILAKIAKTAMKSDEPHVLIIDEINRANLPSVLGELIYALEYRGEAVETMYNVESDNGNKITIPDNLFIIGTMNTADRSVGHIDYAIKRRFAFVDVLPDANVVTKGKAQDLFKLVEELFVKEESGTKTNSDYLAPDFDYEDVQLGHSYFILKENSDDNEKEKENEEELQMRLKYEILPILNEYVKDGLLLETAKEKIKEIEGFEC